MMGRPSSPGAWDPNANFKRDGAFGADFGRELGHAVVGRFGLSLV